MAIGRIDVDSERFQELWGVTPQDYTYESSHVDLQDLLVVITQKRASAIEAEVTPLQNIITKRNDRLTKESVVLQKLTEAQAQYSDTTKSVELDISSVVSGSNATLTLDEFQSIMEGYGWTGTITNYKFTLSKSECEGLVSRCKSSIDEKNNQAQQDMTRLQSLVDRRDESYSTATSLMTSVSDTRSNLIGNL